MLLAGDHGNYAIKSPFFSFVSGLSDHTVRPPMSDESTLLSASLPKFRRDVNIQGQRQTGYQEAVRGWKEYPFGL